MTKLKSIKREILVVILVWIGIFAVFWQVFYRPQKLRIIEKEQRLEQLISERDRKKAMAQQLDKYRMEMAEIRNKLAEIMTKLPDEKEVPGLLKMVSLVGKSSGLEIESFQLKGEERKSFYAEVPFEMNFVGNYHQIGMFFYQVGQLPRIITIKEFSFSPIKEASGGERFVRLKGVCRGATYYFIEEIPSAGKKDEKKS
jgi:type IV pilus assembly protein PilO